MLLRHRSCAPQRPQRLQPAAIDTYDDHRMAMCFSLASLGGCRVRINDPKCVNKNDPRRSSNGLFLFFGLVSPDIPVRSLITTFMATSGIVTPSGVVVPEVAP